MGEKKKREKGKKEGMEKSENNKKKKRVIKFRVAQKKIWAVLNMIIINGTLLFLIRFLFAGAK